MASSLRFDYANPIIMPKAIEVGKLALEVRFCQYYGSWNSMFNTMTQKHWVSRGFCYIKDLVRTRYKTANYRYIKYCSSKMSQLQDIKIDDPEPWRNVRVDYLGANHMQS